METKTSKRRSAETSSFFSVEHHQVTANDLVFRLPADGEAGNEKKKRRPLHHYRPLFLDVLLPLVGAAVARGAAASRVRVDDLLDIRKTRKKTPARSTPEREPS